MSGPHRQFKPEEDDLIREYIRTGAGLKALAKQLHTGKDTILRRWAALLGVDAPPPLAEDMATQPITVGDDDPLLKRLRKVHGEKAR
jgi:transposase-like protein